MLRTNSLVSEEAALATRPVNRSNFGPYESTLLGVVAKAKWIKKKLLLPLLSLKSPKNLTKLHRYPDIQERPRATPRTYKRVISSSLTRKSEFFHHFGALNEGTTNDPLYTFSETNKTNWPLPWYYRSMRWRVHFAPPHWQADERICIQCPAGSICFVEIHGTLPAAASASLFRSTNYSYWPLMPLISSDLLEICFVVGVVVFSPFGLIVCVFNLFID